jgi:sugar (pentulose or hexulose) kinase
MASGHTAVLVADIGSTSLKAAVVTATGRCLHRRSAPAPGGPGVATQDQELLWERTADLLANVAAAWGRPVESVVVTGQGDGLWTIDSRGRGGVALQWNSVAGADAVARWEGDGVLEDHYRRTGTVLWPGTSAALWRHLRDSDPGRADATRWVLTAPDWVTYRLTGRVATDIPDATIPFLDLATRRWDPEAFARLGVPELAGRVPEPLEPGTPLGALLPEVAGRLGLPAGTPVHLGCLDVVAQALGAGARVEGDAVAVLGTTIAVTPLTGTLAPPGDPVGATVAWVDPGLHLRVLGSSAGVSVLEWFLNTYNYEGGDRYNRFWEDVDRAGSGPEISLPFLYGERVPFLAPAATGAVLGLTPATRREDLARAQAEGLTMALRHCLESSGPIESLVLTGGGSQTPAWCQMVADTLGREVRADADPAIGLRGAASLAPGFAHLRDTVGEARLFRPADRAAELEEHYRRYRNLIDALLPIWKGTR